MNEDLVLTVDDLAITKDAENCVLFSYPDPASPLARELQARGIWQAVMKGAEIPAELLNSLSGSPWTGGWGHTGPDVVPGMTIPQEQADVWLLADMAKSEANVRAHVQIPLTRDEFIALCDFDFNVGNGNFDTSTLLKKLNAGDIDGAVAEFARWNEAGGKVLAGLVKRRDAEKALFLLGANYTTTA
ncbi:lysozyme [Trinickia mobilis]|uniref:lysozyme n=1 Tax=Trinickia mobilis TaxID=2816356 RepID=UPI001A8F18E6|nr:lysozyme [Trinickia mobilis]